MSDKKKFEIIQSIKTVSIALLSAICAKQDFLHIHSFFTSIFTDKAYAITITLFSAIFTCIMIFIEELLGRFCTKVAIAFSDSKNNINIQNVAALYFSEYDTSKLYIEVSISGTSAFFEGQKVCIYFPDWLTVQVDPKHHEILNVEEHVLKINLSKIKGKNGNADVTLPIEIIKDKVFDKSKIEITASLNKSVKNIFVRFKTNSIQIHNESK